MPNPNAPDVIEEIDVKQNPILREENEAVPIMSNFRQKVIPKKTLNTIGQ